MKNIHKAVADDKHPNQAMTFIQVKNGFVYATNSSIAVKIPAEEVFGKDVIVDTDELYFDSNTFSRTIAKAGNKITRDGLLFTCFSRGKNIGSVQAISADAFKQDRLKFPEVDSVYPETDKSPVALDYIGLSPEQYTKLYGAMGVDTKTLRLTFYGPTKAILVTSRETKGTGLIMPCIDVE